MSIAVDHLGSAVHAHKPRRPWLRGGDIVDYQRDPVVAGHQILVLAGIGEIDPGEVEITAVELVFSAPSGRRTTSA
jgi:hypothetical protein